MARQRWWPLTLPEQYQKVTNFKNKIGGYTVPLGLTLGQVTAYTALCDAFLGAYDFRSATAQTDQAVTDWRDQVWYGEPKGGPVSPAPVFAVKGAVTYTRGTVTQFFEMRDYILSLAGYTEAIGEDLGLIGAEQDAPDLGSLQPTLKLDAAAQGRFEFAALIGNRGDSDQWILSAAPVGTNDWQQIGTFTGKAAHVTWPGTGTNPVQLQCRVQLRRKNENYGQPSNIVTVTVIP